MTGRTSSDRSAPEGAAPSKPVGALSGLAVVLGFTVFHNVFIVDIWFNIGPMMFAGALCGLCIVWSYRQGVPGHSTSAWLRYCGFYAAELVALGAVSLAVLRPEFTMAELIVADDAFERLLPPSTPLIIGAIAVGTVAMWLYCGRRRAAFLPILITQVLVVFLLGHQFAFLGLVESTSALMTIFGGFALITVGLATAFGLLAMWSTILLERFRIRPNAN